MNINQKILQLEKELQELKEQVKVQEQAKNKTPIGWVPERGEDYHFIDCDGDIVFQINNGVWDDTVAEHYKVFKTEIEAAVYAEKMKVIRELEKFAKEFVYGEENWAIAYNHAEGRIYYTLTKFMRSNLIYFESRKTAQEAVQAVGEERIKKYYLGVEG